MIFLLGIFSFNGSLLIWATGGLASPFIPFYIMVFILTLSYCKFPQPATNLTFMFVAFFLIFILLSEFPLVQRFVPVPIDGPTQIAINNLYAKKFFDGGFVTASMLVPLISMYLAAKRTGGDGLPAAAETVTGPRPEPGGLAVAAEPVARGGIPSTPPEPR